MDQLELYRIGQCLRNKPVGKELQFYIGRQLMNLSGICLACRGKGRVRPESFIRQAPLPPDVIPDCENCNGSGYLRKYKEVTKDA